VPSKVPEKNPQHLAIPAKFQGSAIDVRATLPPSENTYGDRHMQSLHLFQRTHLLKSIERLKAVTPPITRRISIRFIAQSKNI
jgi:hypothetical protein